MIEIPLNGKYKGLTTLNNEMYIIIFISNNHIFPKDIELIF